MDESVTKYLEQPKVGTLKLSEAIRIGARMRPQCTAVMFDNGKSCALGAAYEAVYGYPGNGRYGFSSDHNNKMLEEWLSNAFSDLSHVEDSIWHLNDSGAMTREQIADWLEAQGH